MAGKRKAEGIALLSLYNDEGDDEDDEDEEEEDEGEEEEEQHEKHENQQEQEGKRLSQEEGDAQIETVTEIVSVKISLTTIEVSEKVAETLIPPLPVVPSQEEDDLTQSPVVEKASNGARGIIVDYAHDEGALSPEAEEGEIMSTGRAVFGLGMPISNGFFQGITPPSIVNTARPDNVQLDEQSLQLKIVTSQISAPTSPTTEPVDLEMTDAKDLDTKGSDLDTLADFLPPPPVVKCSQELQNKFSKFLALKNNGRSFNEELRKSKGYRNPDFLQRAVKHQEIDQIGSCFSKEVFNPHGYDPSDFYDALALEFRREQERKEQAKKQSQRIDFSHGGVQAAQMSAVTDKGKPVLPLPTEQKGPANTDPLSSGSQVSDAAPKLDSARVNKKSKWDKVDADTRGPPPMPTVAKSAIAAASAHSALLTANAGGGYASFVLQKRKEAEERSRGSDRKADRK